MKKKPAVPLGAAEVQRNPHRLLRAALIVALAIPLSFLFAMTGMVEGKISGKTPVRLAAAAKMNSGKCPMVFAGRAYVDSGVSSRGW